MMVLGIIKVEEEETEVEVEEVGEAEGEVFFLMTKVLKQLDKILEEEAVVEGAVVIEVEALEVEEEDLKAQGLMPMKRLNWNRLKSKKSNKMNLKL